MPIREHAIFRKLDQPHAEAAGGSSYIYHSNDACVDTGVHIFGEGFLTLSLNEIKELAEVAGFSVNEDGQAVEERNAELERQVAALEAENEELVAELRAIGTAVRRAAE